VNLIINIENNINPKKILFVSRSKQFMIVSISKRQMKFFIKTLLLGYYEKLKKGSFLQRIYGAFKLVIKGNIYRLLIMENPKYVLDDPNITIIRGLYTNRRVNITPVSNMISERLVTAPDPNDISRNSKFMFSPENRRHILSVIYSDMKFLRKASAIDYTIEIYSGDKIASGNIRNMFLESSFDAHSVVFNISNFLNVDKDNRCFKRRKRDVSSLEYANSLTSHFSSVV
jgi:hypothetical protein